MQIFRVSNTLKIIAIIIHPNCKLESLSCLSVAFVPDNDTMDTTKSKPAVAELGPSIR